MRSLAATTVVSILFLGQSCSTASGRIPAAASVQMSPVTEVRPAMGWNSWNVFGCNVDEQKIRNAADALIKSGLAAHGYHFVNIDDCWQGQRRADGEIQPNERFHDIKALADYVHSKGLSIGIYSSPGAKTCAGYEGSLGHEAQDAKTYAKWGIDYLKYDRCSFRGDDRTAYALMGQSLRASGRDIYYSLCQYGRDKVWEWGASVGANSWRTTHDITDTWWSIRVNGFSQAGLEGFAGPGHWNDPDMLVVGQLGWNGKLRPTQLTVDEQFTHIALWTLLSSPLLIGADLTKLDKFTYDLLTNDEVIAVDQDVVGRQASRVINRFGFQVWTKPLSDGSTAVGIFNVSDDDDQFLMTTNIVGRSGPMKFRDLWLKKDLGSHEKLRFQVPTHGVVFLRIS